MSIIQAASNTGVGVCNSALTIVNTVTSTVNMLNVASQAGNIKAYAWLSDVKHSTMLDSAVSKEFITEDFKLKVARRQVESAKAMQDPALASAYAAASKFVDDVLARNSAQIQSQVQPNEESKATA